MSKAVANSRVRRAQTAAGLGAVAALLIAAVNGVSAQETPGPVEAGGSGLQIPRYVSLKSDRVNLRQGPGTEYPIAWVFRRAGLPVEVIREFDGWRQVRDSEGTTGWVLASLWSGRRTAVVLPWEASGGPSSGPSSGQGRTDLKGAQQQAPA